MRGRPNPASAASRAVAIAALVLISSLAVAQPQKAGPKIDADAERILRSMTGYFGGLQAFTVAYDVDDEVVDTDGQKLAVQQLRGRSRSSGPASSTRRAPEASPMRRSSSTAGR